MKGVEFCSGISREKSFKILFSETEMTKRAQFLTKQFVGEKFESLKIKIYTLLSCVDIL